MVGLNPPDMGNLKDILDASGNFVTQGSDADEATYRASEAEYNSRMDGGDDDGLSDNERDLLMALDYLYGYIEGDPEAEAEFKSLFPDLELSDAECKEITDQLKDKTLDPKKRKGLLAQRRTLKQRKKDETSRKEVQKKEEREMDDKEKASKEKQQDKRVDVGETLKGSGKEHSNPAK